MVASFNNFKDYHAFNEVAEKISKIRKDIMFLGAGDGPNRKKILNSLKSELKEFMIYPGKVHEIESLINIFDIGMLLTNKKLNEQIRTIISS